MSFLEISLETCGEVYPVIRRNADRHFRSAKILSKEKEYPHAVSHLILGTEELIKSFVLLLENIQFNLRAIKGYKKLFYNHSATHSIIKEFFSVWVFFRQLLDIKKNKRNENTALYWLGIAGTVLRGVLSGVNNYEWWNTADTLKQNCFYVDYTDKIISPNTVKEAKYMEAEKHVNSFYEDIRFLMAVLARANDKQLEEFRKLFKETEMKELMQESIQRSAIKP
jgi:AbiV family abortive infection protein